MEAFRDEQGLSWELLENDFRVFFFDLRAIICFSVYCFLGNIAVYQQLDN